MKTLQLDAFESFRARDEGIEIWRDLVGFDYPYQVSNTAKVRVLDRPTSPGSQKRKDRKKVIIGRELNQRYRLGYKAVTLRMAKKWCVLQVHRLVAIAFIPNPDNLPFINHINGVRDDNRIENLEWCTPKQNAKHAYDIGLAKTGEQASCAKLKEKDVFDIFHKVMNGVPGSVIARQYGVYRNAIYHILHGKNWRRFTERSGLMEKYQQFKSKKHKAA